MEQDQKMASTHDERPTHVRSDLHLTRRFWHMGAGMFVALVYGQFLAHQEAVYIIGGVSSLVYILEQIRIKYPEITKKSHFINSSLLRAEEELKESSALPFIMGLLLTILSFPKPVALVSIMILALGDPLSAIVGIKYGNHRLASGKSLEGSGAFFVACFFAVMLIFDQGPFGARLALAFWHATLMALFEQVPLRLDDNLTIPITSAFLLWPLSVFFEVPIP